MPPLLLLLLLFFLATYLHAYTTCFPTHPVNGPSVLPDVSMAFWPPVTLSFIKTV
jgi:hypothetical protein